jgi:hypothetical protein
MEKALPMLELGLLVGISDAKGFEKAMTEYRKTLNEMYEKVREASPEKDNIPDFKIPAPEIEKGKAGNLIFYPIPAEFGLDSQVQPVAGIGKNVSVLTLSKKHADRLLVSTPVKIKGLDFSPKKELIGAAILNWPALVDAAVPWVEMGLTIQFAAGAEKLGPGKKDKPGPADLMKTFKVAVEVLKCFKGATAATYLEDGKLVTHTQIVVKDLHKTSK